MGKITDLRDRFKSATLSHSNLNTFMDEYVYDVNKVLNKQMPLLLLEPPQGSEISGYKSRPFENYSVSMWVCDQKKLKDPRDIWEIWEQVKDYGFDIIDTVTSTATRPITYSLNSGVSISNFPDVGNDRLVACQFTFDIELADCRNKT